MGFTEWRWLIDFTMKVVSPVLPYRPDVNGLRAIAIVSVILFHAFPKFIRGAFFGVDIFFVISGYLISTILIRDYANQDFRYSRFYYRRARRIFPALFMVLATVALAGWFLLLPEEYARLGKHLAAGVGFVANLTLLQESGYFDFGAMEKPLLHLWSLGVEEQYYLLWPLIISLAMRASMLVSTIIGVMALSFTGNVWFIHQAPEAVFYLPLTRVWELASGSLVAALQFRYSGKLQTWLNQPGRLRPDGMARQEWVAMLGLLLLLTSYVVIQGSQGFPGVRALLPVSATVCLIVAGSGAWINRRLLANRVMVYLGLISYPWYLWHWPLLSLESIIDNGQRNRPVILLILGVSLLLADLTWRWVESPVRRSRTAVPVWILTLLLAVLGGWGGWAYLNRGWPERMARHEQGADFMDMKIPRWERRCPGDIPTGAATLCLANHPKQAEERPRRLLFIGDSHAVAFSGTAQYLAEDPLPAAAMQVVAKGGCIPFAWMEMANKTQDCHPFFRDVYAYAAHDDALATVVLIGRWAIRLTGEGFGIDDEAMLHLFRDVRMPDATLSQEALFTRGLRETLDTLTRSGRRVIFVHQVPELGFKPNFCLPRPVSFYPAHPCTIPRVEVEARQAAYRAKVADILRDFPDVGVFDPLPYLCDAQVCRAIINGVFMYFDDDHLSNAGARLLGKHFQPLIEASMRPPARDEP